jgi:iron complex outermembrane receptor protein
MIRLKTGASAVALALSGAFGGAAVAQARAGDNAGQDSELVLPASVGEADGAEIVVTGSLLGRRRNSAAPVELVTHEDLAVRGSPTPTELVKSLTVAAGTIGDSNQFSTGKGQRAEGTGTINLRGLGPERTLVLLNGRRVPLVNGVYSDVLKLPFAALERIEILKDGAAATYGSDAVAGVVNFITRDGFEGLELGADYRFVDGSEGDFGANATWGSTKGRMSLLLSAAYQHRGELRTFDRDFTTQGYSENPENNWNSTSNPAQYLPVDSAFRRLTSQPITDIACTTLGGVLTNPNGGATPSGFNSCRTQNVAYSNIVDEQTAYQLYGSVKLDLGGTTALRVDAQYSRTQIPRVRGAPTFPVSRSPTVTVLPPGFPVSGGATPSPAQSTVGYYIPATNPGFAAYVAANPGQFPGGATGAFLQSWRPFGVSGNPLFPDDGASRIERKTTQYRVSAELEGTLAGGLGWNLAATFGQYDFFRTGYDVVANRMQLALRGLGGEGCDFRTGSPGVGSCLYFNPFSNAIERNSATGQVNPGFNPAVANRDLALARWLFPEYSETTTSRLYQIDALVQGGLFDLPGGEIRWAIGGQLRRNDYINRPNGLLNNALFPCVDTPVTGSMVCTPRPASPLALGGTDSPLDLKQDIRALFGEIALPFATWATADLAVRFEDYGENGGSTFNPQARVKLQPLTNLGFRGSIGRTFRAPPLNLLITDPVITTQNVLGSIRPVAVQGNPDLDPERALTYSLGTLLTFRRFSFSVDFWNIALKDAIASEPLIAVVNSLFPNNGNPPTGNCATADAAYIAEHFDFNGACSAANLIGVKTSRINGPAIDTSGFDFELSYEMPDFGGGRLRVSASATHVRKYEVGDLLIGGVLASSRVDLAGKYNSGNALAYPLPEWRGSLDLNYEVGPHNFHGLIRFTSSYQDNRAIFTPSPNYCTVNPAPTGCGLVTNGQRIRSIALLDLAYRVSIPGGLVGTVSMSNVFDSDPPFARTELGYDALTGDPLGRTLKLSLQKRF